MEKNEKNMKNFDRWGFYKRATKAIDEGNWDEARVNLEFLIAYVDICETKDRWSKKG